MFTTLNATELRDLADDLDAIVGLHVTDGHIETGAGLVAFRCDLEARRVRVALLPDNGLEGIDFDDFVGEW